MEEIIIMKFVERASCVLVTLYFVCALYEPQKQKYAIVAPRFCIEWYFVWLDGSIRSAI